MSTADHRLIITLLVAMSLLVFGRTIGFDFVNWDDNDNLYRNPFFNPPTWDGLTFFWTHSYKQFYLPLTYTVWWILSKFATLSVPDEKGIWLNPSVFHLTNVALHAASVVLAWQVLRRVVRDDWAAAIGALVWGLHPLKVEPVAWVTGMKDVLSGFWALAAIVQFQAAIAVDDRRRRRVRLAGSVIAYFVAMLCKPTMVAALPIAVVLAIWEDRHRWRTAARGGLVLAAFAVPIVLLALYLGRTTGLRFTYPLWARPLVAGDAAAFYLCKTFVPWPLTITYGRSPAAVIQSGVAYWTWIAPTALLGLAFALRRRAGWMLACSLIFLLGIVPASGLVPFGYQPISTVADRYMYLPLLGAAGASAVAVAVARYRARRATWALATMAVIALGLASWEQAGTWRDSTVLFAQLVKVNPQSFGRSLYAAELQNDGRLDEALRVMKSVVADEPDDFVARVRLAQLLDQTGHKDEAVAQAKVVSDLFLRHPDRLPHLTVLEQARLGAILQLADTLDGIIATVRPRLSSNDARTRVHLAMLMAGGGRRADAEALLDQAKIISPRDELVADARVVLDEFSGDAGGRQRH
ncbi:MAG TPA: tetratricopeptide repeat protein [Tepidisphaeraceae bacterium]|nr:tetratricopeptide repeat protein [Tepidisphaeraceae bacterium]